MPSRDEMLRVIDEAMAARQRGEKDALGAYLAEGATYHMAAKPELLPRISASGEGALLPQVHELMDLFQFHDLARLDAIAEGNQIAVRWSVRASTGGGEPVATELFDLWTFDDDCKVRSVRQFGDTALIVHMLG